MTWANVAQAAQWHEQGLPVEYRPHSRAFWLTASPEDAIFVDYEYRLAQRKIKIGDREVNSPVENGTALWLLTSINGIKRDTDKVLCFATDEDCLAARDAIVALLTGAK